MFFIAYLKTSLSRLNFVVVVVHFFFKAIYDLFRLRKMLEFNFSQPEIFGKFHLLILILKYSSLGFLENE